MPTLSSHLDYYTRHGINPVRYDTSDPRLHLERRASLYRTVGLTSLAVRGARVLEVAPGTGQNSLYLALQSPANLTLVEPNPVARRDIAAVYAAAASAVVQPRVVPCRFEEFDTEDRFDIVVCENWLGDSEHERSLIRKLGTLIADGGVLIVTAVSPVGVLPNVLRRALSNRLAPADKPFETRTAALAQAFGPHLSTVAGMTRNVTDWVHDTMMNPAYLGVLLTVPMAISELGEAFDVLGTSPRFGRDWRWFKSLCGENRDFNSHTLAEYHAALHNFLDHRTVLPSRPVWRNIELEEAARGVADAVRDWESGTCDADVLEEAVRRVMSGISDLPAPYSAALDEFLDAFAEPRLTPESVAGMQHLGPLFGRETIYASFEKRPA